jgi:hypothetical protein
MSRNFSDPQLKAISAGLDQGTPLDKIVLPPSPKRRKNEESQMQRNLIRWWSIACRGFGIHEWMLFSIPNGGGGGEKRGYWLRLEGARRGPPDLVLTVPRAKWGGITDPRNHSFAGLFLELKTPTGRLSPEQKIFHEHLTKNGYRVAVCRSLDEAVKTIAEYLT